MKIKKISTIFSAFLLIFAYIFSGATTPVLAATTTVNLGTADPFAIIAHSHMIDSVLSTVTGNVGLSPAGWGSSSPTITCAEVTGTIYSVDGSGPLPCRVTDPGLLTTAVGDVTTAYGDAGGRTPFTTLAGGDNQLGTQTLTDGVYRFSHATTANLTGTLTLDGQGNSNSVFIFQAASDLITASSSVVSLVNGAQACNVFWYVPTSATFGTGSTFVGTVMANASIVDNGGSTINGRFLVNTADVTINNTKISKPTCTTPAPISTSIPTSIAGGAMPPVYVCPTIIPGVVAPAIIDSHRVDANSIYLSWGPYSGTDKFNVRYGTTEGNLIYNVDVTGFSTTISSLPANQPIWVQVAARNDCQIGPYGQISSTGQAKLVGAPGLPNTGANPNENNTPLYISVGVLTGMVILATFQRKNRYSSKH